MLTVFQVIMDECTNIIRMCSSGIFFNGMESAAIYTQTKILDNKDC